MNFIRLIPRALFQRIRPETTVGLTDYYIKGFQSRYQASCRQLDFMPNASCILEIGCGRDLHASIIAAVRYKKKVIAFDVSEIAEVGLINFTLEKLDARPIDKIGQLEDIGITYVVGKSIREISDAYDGVMSATSFEHIPEAALTDLMQQLEVTLPVGGRFTADIDYKDHWSYICHVGPDNFYRLNETQFSILNNSRMYQNRLRHSDYVKLLRAHGFIEVHTEVARLNSEFDRRRLAKRFQSYGDDDLQIASALLCYEKSR